MNRHRRHPGPTFTVRATLQPYEGGATRHFFVDAQCDALVRITTLDRYIFDIALRGNTAKIEAAIILTISTIVGTALAELFVIVDDVDVGVFAPRAVAAEIAHPGRRATRRHRITNRETARRVRCTHANGNAIGTRGVGLAT